MALWLKYVLIAVIGYLLGNVSVGILVARLYGIKDIRTVGSGNAGTTNVLRNLGWVPSVLTLAGDCLKGLIAALIGKWIAGDMGVLIGGNFAVIAELIGTPYDIIQPGTILFIEDIAEPIYKIERMLYQLKMSGVLARLNGLIVGQFTDYKPDDNYDDMYDMIRNMLMPYDYPVAYNVPVGHVDHNLPLIESATVTLKVSPSGRNSIIFHRTPENEH